MFTQKQTDMLNDMEVALEDYKYSSEEDGNVLPDLDVIKKIIEEFQIIINQKMRFIPHELNYVLKLRFPCPNDYQATFIALLQYLDDNFQELDDRIKNTAEVILNYNAPFLCLNEEEKVFKCPPLPVTNLKDLDTNQKRRDLSWLITQKILKMRKQVLADSELFQLQKNMLLQFSQGVAHVQLDADLQTIYSHWLDSQVEYKNQMIPMSELMQMRHSQVGWLGQTYQSPNIWEIQEGIKNICGLKEGINLSFSTHLSL